MAAEPNSQGVGSMPGAELQHLADFRLHFPGIVNNSLAIFSVLAPAKRCFVITERPGGSRDTVLLTVPLDPGFPPIISTGIITPGMWGNCPSGETFALPSAYEAHGQIYIDGSLPRRPLRNREWCLLHIVEGRIQHPIRASSQQLQDYANGLFSSPKGRVHSKNSNTVAEFGVGASAGIAKLIGNPLFDEKMLGTLHLGIGSNQQFDGPIQSRIHHDVVCARPRLVVDQIVLLADGQFNVSAKSAYRPVSEFSPLPDVNQAVRLGKIVLSKSLSREDVSDSDYVIDPRKVGHWFTTTTTTRGPKVHNQIVEKTDAPLVEKIMASLRSSPTQALKLKTILDFAPSRKRARVPRIINGLVVYGIVEFER